MNSAAPRRVEFVARIPIPTVETMSAEQRRVYDAIVGLRGGHMPAPYQPALHAPELTDKWQQLGELLRYRTSLPARLSELAVLVAARHHDCQYVWQAHAPVALKCGGSDPDRGAPRGAETRRSRRL
jgi:4-carboxymuconolactone decarboxylase